MPLSEDEQRILTEIEQQLYATDPDLARHVGSTTVYTGSMRRARWSVVGLVVGLVAVLALLQVSYVLSFVVGFGLMLFSTWHLDRNLRQIGRAGIQQMTRSKHTAGLREYFTTASERAKERFKRDEDDDNY